MILRLMKDSLSILTELHSQQELPSELSDGLGISFESQLQPFLELYTTFTRYPMVGYPRGGKSSEFFVVFDGYLLDISTVFVFVFFYFISKTLSIIDQSDIFKKVKMITQE